jgi:hypothetical protein
VMGKGPGHPGLIGQGEVGGHPATIHF